MARYDKYDPKVGGFRAFLATDWILDTDLNKVWPVGLNVNGQVVKGAGQTGVLGVLVITRKMYAADEPVDVMTDGEIVEFAGVAGTNYYAAAADGAISDTNTGTYIGHTVEATRLIVRVRPA